MKKSNERFKLKDLEQYNQASFNEILTDLEEEKAYLTRLIQKAKNEHQEFNLNALEFDQEVNDVTQQIEAKENLLYTLSKKKSRPIPQTPIQNREVDQVD